MYSIFDRVLKSDKEKAFIRQHKDNYDAQSIFIILVDYYTKSARATLELSNILSYITSVYIDSSSQKRTAEGFILHWQD